jgi:hypothetical protein
MVKAAYSSGTPAYGVGVGNAVHVVDETADLDAAQMIANAKTFDCATSCLADNSVAAHSSIYETLKWKLVERGGHVCASAEKARLQAVMWPKGERIPSPRQAALILSLSKNVAHVLGRQQHLLAVRPHAQSHEKRNRRAASCWDCPALTCPLPSPTCGSMGNINFL